MVKQYTRRALMKRSVRKRRRSVRLQNTVRRKLHKGGNGGAAVFALIIPIILSVVGLENAQKVVNVVSALSGVSNGGGKKHQKGGAVSPKILGMLNDLKNDLPADAANLKNCIDTLIIKLNAATPNNQGSNPPPPPPTSPVDTSSFTTSFKDQLSNVCDGTACTMEVITANIKKIGKGLLSEIQNSMNTAIEKRLINIRSKYNLDDKDIECIRSIKAFYIDKMTNKLDAAIADIKGSQAVQGAIKAMNFAKGALGSLTGRIGSFSFFNKPVETPPPPTVSDTVSQVSRKKKKKKKLNVVAPPSSDPQELKIFGTKIQAQPTITKTTEQIEIEAKAAAEKEQQAVAAAKAAEDRSKKYQEERAARIAKENDNLSMTEKIAKYQAVNGGPSVKTALKGFSNSLFGK